jgi:UDP-2-acetamido-3-amino-2,3-dideoxy-glucuronate N-acetyltransferase
MDHTEKSPARIHPTAEVSPQASIGAGSRIWHYVQIREGVTLGEDCIVGKDVYIDFDVKVGNNVKVQNGSYLYHGLTVEDGVFVGPRVVFTNDLYPRAISPDGQLKGNDDWEVGPITVRYGASIGTGAIIIPNVTVGRFAMVAAGAVVTHDVPDHGLVMGVPARLVGYVCRCGHKLVPQGDSYKCPVCHSSYHFGEQE